MPIEIKHNKPTGSYDLGGANFYTDADTAGCRYVSVSADSGRHCRRPIDVHANSDDLRTMISFSVDEAEALVACLTHAISLRRQAEKAA